MCLVVLANFFFFCIPFNFNEVLFVVEVIGLRMLTCLFSVTTIRVQERGEREKGVRVQ